LLERGIGDRRDFDLDRSRIVAVRRCNIVAGVAERRNGGLRIGKQTAIGPQIPQRRRPGSRRQAKFRQMIRAFVGNLNLVDSVARRHQRPQPVEAGRISTEK
jgi:hypothetical protein